jgi:pyruvate, orthophosphate dikinase
MADRKWVYDFAEGSKDMRELLGGKGANVAEMTRVLGADRVPAGFTITTEACVAYMRDGQQEPDGMADEVAGALERLQEHTGKRLGDAEDPLLVSVRSGARESMPSPARRRTSASPGTPTGASCRCSATSPTASPASSSRTRSRR